MRPCKSCIDGGFTSVMIDASSKPFAENIEITKKVVEYAHDHGVVVEAELGALAGVEDEVKVSAEDSHYTRPEEVEEFVSKTGCDSLAIAIGTSHGAYKFTAAQCTRNEKGELVPPPLRFDILDEVVQAPARLPHRAPRLLLRASGVREDDQRERRQDARRCGHPRGSAASGRPGRRVQDQHRLRSASGHDRHHPQVSSPSIPPTSTPGSI